jgi:hypothetical protein
MISIFKKATMMMKTSNIIFVLLVYESAQSFWRWLIFMGSRYILLDPTHKDWRDFCIAIILLCNHLNDMRFLFSEARISNNAMAMLLSGVVIIVRLFLAGIQLVSAYFSLVEVIRNIHPRYFVVLTDLNFRIQFFPPALVTRYALNLTEKEQKLIVNSGIGDDEGPFNGTFIYPNLPGVLVEMTGDQADALVNSFVSRGIVHDENLNDSSRALVRLAKSIGPWRHSEEDRHRICDFLVLVWRAVPSIFSDGIICQVNIFDKKLISMPLLEDLVQKEDCVESCEQKVTKREKHKNQKKNKKDTKISVFRLAHDNMLREFVDKTIPNQYLTMQKIKSMLHQLRKDGWSKKTIVGIFSRKMFMLRDYDFDTVPVRQYSWWVPYLQPDHFKIHGYQLSDFYRYWDKVVMALRSSILKYVENYCSLLIMDDHEIKGAMKHCSLRFVQILKNPENQLLFCTLSKEQVCDRVFNSFFYQIRTHCMNTSEVSSLVDNKRRLKDKIRSKARDTKNLRNDYDSFCDVSDEFQVNSGNSENKPLGHEENVDHLIDEISDITLLEEEDVNLLTDVVEDLSLLENVDVVIEVSDTDSDMTPEEDYAYSQQPLSFGNDVESQDLLMMPLPFIFGNVRCSFCDQRISVATNPYYIVITCSCRETRIVPGQEEEFVTESSPIVFIVYPAVKLFLLLQFLINFPGIVGSIYIAVTDPRYALSLSLDDLRKLFHRSYAHINRGLLQPTRQFLLNVRTLHRGYRRTVDMVGGDDLFDTLLSDPLAYIKKMPDRMKLVLLNMKSLVHMIYCAYNGDFVGACAWASNLLISESHRVIGLLQTLVDSCLGSDNFAGELYYGGTTYRVHPEQFNYYRHNPEQLPDMISVNSAPIGPIVSTIVGLVRTIHPMEDEEIRSANAMFTYMNNVSRTTDATLGSMSHIISFLCRLLFGCDPLNQEYQIFLTEMIEHITFCDEALLVQDIESNVPYMEKVLTVYERACKMRVDLACQTMPSFLTKRFDTCLKDMSTLAATCSACISSSRFRTEPLFIMMGGPAGVGKSSVTQFFMRTIAAIEKKKPYTADMCYSPVKGSLYWEKYAKQDFVLLDDMFVTAVLEDRKAEAADIINMVNSVPFPLNTAFGDKGTRYFDTPYMFGSTNITSNGFDKTKWDVGLTDVGALLRRIHLGLYRKEKAGGRIEDMKFTIQKIIPEYDALLNREYPASKIAMLILQLKQVQYSGHAGTVSYDALREVFPGMIDDSVNCEEKPSKMARIRVSNEEFIAWMNSEGNVENPLLRPFGCGAQQWRMYPEQTVEPNSKPAFSVFETVAAYGRLSLVDLQTHYNGNYKYMLGAIVLLSTTILAATVYKMATDKDQFNTESPPERVGGNFDFWNVKGKKRLKSWKKNAHDKKKREMVPNSLADTQLAMLSGFGKCILHVRGLSPRRSDVCVGIHLQNHYIMVPAHFYIGFQDRDKARMIITYSDGRKVEFPFPPDDEAIQVFQEDAVVFSMPHDASLPGQARFVKSEDKPEMLHDGQVLYLLTMKDETLSFRPVNLVHQPDMSYNAVGETFLIQDGIAYKGESGPGDSGAALVSQYANGSPCIVGMHVGKRGPIGVAIPYTDEHIQNLLNDFHPESDPSDFQIIRTVSPGYYCNRKNKIVKTDLFGWAGPPHKVPAILGRVRIGDEYVDPLVLARKKLHSVEAGLCDVSPSTLRFLQNSYLRRVDRSSSILTWDEALNGSVDKGFSAICYNTSPGYEFSGGNGKADYIDRIEDKDMFVRYEYKPHFLERLIREDNILQSGGHVEFIYCDVLKQETRPVEKVRAGKTRLFGAGQLNALIIYRRYFLDFIEFVQSMPASNYVSVGINPHGPDWTYLHARMLRLGGNVVAGDYSNWDGAVPAGLGKIFVDFVNYWYDDGPVNARVREDLIHSVVHSVRISGCTIYQVHDGVPSGVAITAIYNSFCNIMMMYTVLVEDLNISDFDMAVYGDDNIIATYEKLRCNDFSPHLMRRFGMTYTHFSKEETDRYDTISTIRYLGRAFVKDKTFIRAPLAIDVVCESTYWRTTSSDEHTVIISVAQTFFLELSHFPQETFERLLRKFMVALKNSYPLLYQTVEKYRCDYNTYFYEMYIGRNINPSYRL